MSRQAFTTLVGMAVLCALCLGGMWVYGPPPPEYPTQQEQAAAEARRPAPPVKHEKSKPVTFKATYKPPAEELKRMAARTGTEMGETWNANVAVVSQTTTPAADKAITHSVSFGALGGYAAIINEPVGIDGTWCRGGDPMEHNATDPPYDPLDDYARWWGLYHPFTVRCNVGMEDSDEALIWLWVGDYFGYPSFMGSPYGGTIVRGPTLSLEASIVVSGLYIKRGRTSSTPSSRQTMDFTDLTGEDKWYADENTIVTVTCGPCSASGSLGYTEGQEVEIGSTFGLGVGINMNSAPTANTVYARVSNIKWGGTAIGGSAVDLYNPGDANHMPNATVAPGWSRVQTTNNCYHVKAGSTIEMDHLQGTTSSGTFSAVSLAPLIMKLNARDGKFDCHGASYDVEYTGPFIRYVWDEDLEDYVSEVIPFVTSYSAVQSHASWLYEHEWRKFSSNNVQVRVTPEWRLANGEDVGGDIETQNDQRCGILMIGRDKTSCTDAPWWFPGLGISHRASTNVNDTYGLAQRASWWMGNAGVNVAPDDNDIWTVPAGAVAPAVSRALRTRYWLRMERLAECIDDPEAEHLQHWPIMLRANIGIDQTLDDPDWWTAPKVIVSGAGTAAVNGDFAEFGSGGGEQQYNKGTYYVRYDRASAKWQIINDTSVVFYECSTLGGSWSVVSGASPAPAVALDAYQEYGHTATAGEDIFNWANYRYLLLGIDAPRAGTVRLQVDYAVPSVDDPCYVGFNYRFGAEGEWTYSTTTYRLTYDVAVEAGSGTYLIDMMVNNEGKFPVGDRRMQVVSTVTVILPDNTTETADEWELTGLQLVHDPGEGAREEPVWHLAARFKPSWSWIGYSWFGFGAVVDGKDALEIDYGYGSGNIEKKLLYIQRSEHNPDYQGEPIRLDVAKPLGALFSEVSWQEGFAVTYPYPGPDEHTGNMYVDADEVEHKVDANLYWWDIENSNEDICPNIAVALCTGTWSVVAGIEYNVDFYKYPDGAVHGIAVNSGAVLRSCPDAVEVFGSYNGGDWTLQHTINTDEHGRFRIPLKEKNWAYRIAGNTFSVVNRSYTTVFTQLQVLDWRRNYPYPGYYRDRADLHRFASTAIGEPGDHTMAGGLHGSGIVSWTPWFKQGIPGADARPDAFRWDPYNRGMMALDHHGDGRRWVPRKDGTV